VVEVRGWLQGENRRQSWTPMVTEAFANLFEDIGEYILVVHLVR
jgi:hypothetical protein